MKSGPPHVHNQCRLREVGEEGMGGVGGGGVRGKAPRQINHRLGCSVRRWRMMIGEERRQLLGGRQQRAIPFSIS